MSLQFLFHEGETKSLYKHVHTKKVAAGMPTQEEGNILFCAQLAGEQTFKSWLAAVAAESPLR
jgi:hypothetical protein